MASIEISIPSTLNRGLGERRIRLEADTLKDAIDALVMILGNDFARRVLDANGKPKALINIYINGKNARFLGGLDAKLNDNDKITILPAVAGGGSEEGNHSYVELTPYELERYSRQIMLDSIGYEGQLRLKNARVCVVGAGGLGSPIAMQLAAMGIGYIRIVDRDVVELSNLHRQVLYTDDDIGYVKVERAAKRLKSINPNAVIEPLAVSVNSSTAYEIIRGCDLVIDGLDSIDARYALNDACLKAGIPYVYGGALGMLGSVCTVIPSKSACIRCIFPELSDDEMPTCSIEGVHPSILYIVSAIQVAEAVRIIVGSQPMLINKLLYIDLNDLSFNTIDVVRNEHCICSNGIAVTAKTKEAVTQRFMVEELCGRDMGKRTFSITPSSILSLDLDRIKVRADSLGFKQKSRGEMGITLVNGNGQSISILKSGSAVVVGTNSKEDALMLYENIINS
jgi:Dinucleotide-utilizing enzymes involved in molybdopterin and thiamine biosynthesis family 2